MKNYAAFAYQNLLYEPQLTTERLEKIEVLQELYEELAMIYLACMKKYAALACQELSKGLGSKSVLERFQRMQTLKELFDWRSDLYEEL